MRKRQPESQPFTFEDAATVRAGVYALRSEAVATDEPVANALAVVVRLRDLFGEDGRAHGSSARQLLGHAVITMSQENLYDDGELRRAALVKWHEWAHR